MKLVDILALELKAWPEGVDSVWQSSCDNEIYFDADVPTFYTSLNAEDSGTQGAVITQAQWQAAVDALNAPKVVEWDGVGNPPVGVDIECTFDSWGYWRKGRVLYYGKQMIFMEQDGESPDGRKFEGSMNPDGIKFRPVRTAEQVAAEERDAKAKELYLTINWNDAGSTWDSLAASRKADYLKAIDAGYRKEPKPCGS